MTRRPAHQPRTPPRTLPVAHLRIKLLWLNLFWFASFCPTVPAQTVPDDDVISFRTDLITVPVTVTDRRRRFVNTLTADDFILTDDDQTVSIASLTTGTSQLALAFLLDTSGSTREIIARQQSAALALARRFNQASRVAVLGFDTNTRLIVPFTTELTQAQNAFTLSALSAQTDARTAIFDAADATLNLYSNLPNTSGERRIVILISDGLDTASTTPAGVVINRANRLGISFYVIHIPLYAPRDGRLKPRPFARGFRDLAERTGGKLFQLGDAQTALDPRAANDMTPIFDRIAADLMNQYILAFYPQSNKNTNTSHRINVRLTKPAADKFRIRLLRQSYTLPRPTTSSIP